MEIKKENDFAYNLEFIMRELKLNQSDVANVMGVKRQSISQYLKRETFPTIDKIVLFCNYYMVSSDMMLGIDVDVIRDFYTSKIVSEIEIFLQSIKGENNGN